MAQIDRHPIVPVFEVHILGAVAIVIGSVVYQHPDRSVLPACVGDPCLKGTDILQITLNESWRAMAAGSHTLDQSLGGPGLDVNESHPCVLGTEMFDDALTDSRAAAGHEHDPVYEAGITSVHAVHMEPSGEND